MSWLSKIAGAFFSASNENILALSHIKFDFSLVKLEAPAEFNPLGTAISQMRKTEAEDGKSHRTARRLGALFEQIIPSTPNLISAYGKRVSEIIEKAGINPQGDNNAHGPFQPFIGADATAMWAAATSGTAAISVYLLALLLARAWDTVEATSLWVEIVAERKRRINEAFYKNHVISEASLHSSCQDISREELSRWDASARSWLRSADEAKQRQRDQAMLILNNLRLPFPSGPTTYERVIRTWHEALLGMENMLDEKPQSIFNGSVTLAILSWHLYPNMIVLGNEVKHVQLHDPLFPTSGTCTIGLENRTGDEECGTKWSLTLSHMTFYGSPKTVQSQKDFSRITPEQFLIVTLGSLLAEWHVSDSEVLTATLWIRDLWQIFHKSNLSQEIASAPQDLKWLRYLASASQTVLQACDGKDTQTLKLLNFARRRSRDLLCKQVKGKEPGPFFGLCNPPVLLALSVEPTLDSGIQILREVATKAGFEEGEAIIAVNLYPDPSNWWEKRGLVAIATAVPKRHDPLKRALKRDSQGRLIPSRGHCRWAPSQPHPYPTPNALIEDFSSSLLDSVHRVADLRCDLSRDLSPDSRSETLHWRPDLHFFGPCCSIHLPLASSPDTEAPQGLFYSAETSGLLELSRLRLFIRSDSYRALYSSSDIKSASTAIKKPKIGRGNPLLSLPPRRLYDYLLSLSGINILKQEPEIAFLNRIYSLTESCMQSLHAATLAYDLYSDLKGATISAAVVTSQRQLSDTLWYKSYPIYSHLNPDSINKVWFSTKRAFACLLYFETGKLDLPGDHFQNVFAISVDNSIFTARFLLADPWKRVPPGSLRRLAGNIGFTGISLLVGVKSPQLRSPGNDFTLTEHRPYDSHRLDSFKSTSLHLNFTGWSVPLHTEAESSLRTIDHNISYVESVVSVHDRGKWVADLDLLGIDFGLMYRLPSYPCTDPVHQAQDRPRHSYVSVDGWEELLDPPLESYGIFRANGNWAGLQPLV